MATKFKIKGRSFQITSTSTGEDGCTVKDLDKNTYEHNVDFERVRKFVEKENEKRLKKKVKKLASTKKSIIFVP